MPTVPTVPPAEPRLPRIEEAANALTHGVGAVLSVAGLIGLVALAGAANGMRHTVAAAVYGSTLVVLYVASTCYHCARDDRMRAWLRVGDHAAVFLLIAGTYTPFALVALPPPTGTALLVLVWTLAALGVAFKLVCTGRHERLSVAFYLALGWIGVVAAGPAIESIEPTGLTWLLAGGVLYTGGVAFYVWDRLPFNHAVWHLFVLGGSGCHYLSVYRYVLRVDG